MHVDRKSLVRDIAADSPQAVRIFESLGIDYCCGGKRPLEEACRQAHVPVETVLDELQRPAAEETAGEQWNRASLAELADHIVARHHTFVRQESARLIALLAKVRSRHEAAHPELAKVEEQFTALTSELALHMRKEEGVLFPMIKRLEQASHSERPSSAAGFAGVQFPIRQMILEHDDAGELLTGIRSTTAQFHPPEDACTSFRALYQGLEAFEKDLHQHIHLENNILFPRAIEATQVALEPSSVAG